MHRQKPQCIGEKIDRQLFDGSVANMITARYGVEKAKNGGLHMNVGKVHGISDGDEFQVIMQSSVMSTPESTGRWIAHSTTEFDAMLKPSDEDPSSLDAIEKDAFAIPLRSIGPQQFTVHFDRSMETSFKKLESRRTFSGSRIHIVLEPEVQGHLQQTKGSAAMCLGLDLDNPNRVVFKIARRPSPPSPPSPSPKCRYDTLPNSLSLDGNGRFLDELELVIVRGAQFIWHRDRHPSSDIDPDFITCKIHELDKMHDKGRFKTVGEIELQAQNKTAVLRQLKSEARYGIALENTSNMDFYVSVYYFDNSYLSIRAFGS